MGWRHTHKLRLPLIPISLIVLGLVARTTMHHHKFLLYWHTRCCKISTMRCCFCPEEMLLLQAFLWHFISCPNTFFLWVCVYMSVCTWVCVHECVYMSVCAWVCAWVCVHECVCMSVCAWVCAWVCVHECVCMSVCVHVCIHECAYMCYELLSSQTAFGTSHTIRRKLDVQFLATIIWLL